MYVLVMVIVSFVIMMVLLVLMLLFSFKSLNNNKSLLFECGFMHNNYVFNKFSIHFFMITVIFVIFDMETILFLGLIMSNNMNGIMFLLLMLFVIITLYVEWYMGKLLWLI